MSHPRVFLSHSSGDDEWCRCFCGKLQSLGFDVWIDDQGILGADQFISVIESELEQCDVFVVILTPESWNSTWVQREIQLAIATNKVIVPVMYKPTSVQGFFRLYQWTDVTGKECEDAAKVVAELPALSSNAHDTSGDSTERQTAYNILVESTALLNYTKTHVDDDTMRRAEHEIDNLNQILASVGSEGFLASVRDSLAIYNHAKEIDRYFRHRWYEADERKRVVQRRCSVDWSNYIAYGMDGVAKCCPNEMGHQFAEIVEAYPGLSNWLEDTLITNLVFALWLGKRKLTKDEVFYVHERIGDDRLSAILERVRLRTEAVRR